MHIRKATAILITLATLASCGVSQSEYDELKSENKRLKTTIQKLESENLEAMRRAASRHTEAEALKCLKDYYEFYNPNFAYRKPKVRRVNENTFQISLQTCINKQPFLSDNFHWSSEVLTLKINDDGTYKVN